MGVWSLMPEAGGRAPGSGVGGPTSATEGDVKKMRMIGLRVSAGVRNHMCVRPLCTCVRMRTSLQLSRDEELVEDVIRFMEVEDQVKLAHVSEVAVENLNVKELVALAQRAVVLVLTRVVNSDLPFPL